MENCPRFAYCEFAAQKCERRAVEIYQDLEQTREALGGLQAAAGQPKSGSNLDEELQDITVDEIEDNAYAAILLTDVEILLRAEQRDALESCSRGPRHDLATGRIVCRSALPAAGGYSTAQLLRDIQEFDTGL